MINEQDYFKTRINRKSENECMDECTDECIEKRGGKDGWHKSTLGCIYIFLQGMNVMRDYWMNWILKRQIHTLIYM